MKTALYLIFLAVALISCSVTNKDIEKAQAVCEANGGLSYIDPGITTKVICANGALFMW